MKLNRGLFFCILITALWSLSSCSVIKNIFSKKESTQIEESNASTTSRRTTSDHHWNRFGSSLSSRDGTVNISFDSLTSINIGADGAIHATGYNPVISTTASEFRSDSTSEETIQKVTHQEDSTGKSQIKAKKNLSEKGKYVEKKTDPLPWIFGIGLILFFVWIVRKVTRFVP